MCVYVYICTYTVHIYTYIHICMCMYIYFFLHLFSFRVSLTCWFQFSPVVFFPMCQLSPSLLEPCEESLSALPDQMCLDWVAGRRRAGWWMWKWMYGEVEGGEAAAALTWRCNAPPAPPARDLTGTWRRSAISLRWCCPSDNAPSNRCRLDHFPWHKCCSFLACEQSKAALPSPA